MIGEYGVGLMPSWRMSEELSKLTSSFLTDNIVNRKSEEIKHILSCFQLGFEMTDAAMIVLLIGASMIHSSSFEFA